MTPEQFHKDRVAQCGCIVCRRLGFGWVPGEVHHVAEGTSERSDFATACLCYDHHRGPGGLHGLKARNFVRVFNVTWEKEEGLLVWQNQDLTLLAMGRLPLGVA